MAPILKLRDFQNLGHTIVFIVGDFTGIIGDTSDKEAERPMLSEKEVKKNLKTYFAQAGKVLNMRASEKNIIPRGSKNWGIKRSASKRIFFRFLILSRVTILKSGSRKGSVCPCARCCTR